MRNIARGMVLTTVVLVFVAIIAAQSFRVPDVGPSDVYNPSRHQDLYFTLFMFVPFMLGPAIVVWFRTTAGKFAIWAGCSAFVSLIHLAFGITTSSEPELGSLIVVSIATHAAMFISVVGALIMAWTLAARAREPLSDSPRARRIRSIAKLAPLVAVTSFVLAMFAIDRYYEPIALMMASVLAITLAPAPFVHRRPTRGAAFMWAAWSLPYAALTLAMQFSDDDKMPMLARMLLMATGTLAALLIAVLPLTALLASSTTTIPEAREVA